MPSIELRPQPKQELFHSSRADVVIYGGAKGGGKSWSLRFEPLRHFRVPGFHAVIFRTSYPQIIAEGGLFDKALELYPLFGAQVKASKYRFIFPSSATIGFSHLSLEKDLLKWQGSEVAYIGFDQLEEFTERQFVFLLNCLRSTCGVKPYIRATANPAIGGTSHWLTRLLLPYLASDGYADLDQLGQIKYFSVINDELTYVDQDWRDPNGNPPKSITFIPADVWDNEILLTENPEYLSNLYAQSQVERDRYLGIRGRGGNWFVIASAGKFYKYGWMQVLEPSEIPAFNPARDRMVRFWDFAGDFSETKGDDPDYHASCKMMYSDDTRQYYILDIIETRLTSKELDKLVKNCAIADGIYCSQRWEQERGGSAAIRESARLKDLLKDCGVLSAAGVLPEKDKVTRFLPFSAACEHGHVYMVKAHWNQMLENYLSQFPDRKSTLEARYHDDVEDTCAYAYLQLFLSHVRIVDVRA